jgi:hypothetical protein
MYDPFFPEKQFLIEDWTADIRRGWGEWKGCISSYPKCNSHNICIVLEEKK